MYIAKCCTQSDISCIGLLHGQTYFWTNINYICEGLHTHVTMVVLYCMKPSQNYLTVPYCIISYVYNCSTVLHETFAKLFDSTILHYLICLNSPATMLTRLYIISQIIVFPSRMKSHLVSRGRVFAGQIDRNPGYYPTLAGMSPHSSRVSSEKCLYDIPIDFVRFLREKRYLPHIVVVHVGAANLCGFKIDKLRHWTHTMLYLLKDTLNTPQFDLQAFKGFFMSLILP